MLAFIGWTIGAYLLFVWLLAVMHWSIYRWFRPPANNRWCVGRPGVGRFLFDYFLAFTMPVEMIKILHREWIRGFNE